MALTTSVPTYSDIHFNAASFIAKVHADHSLLLSLLDDDLLLYTNYRWTLKAHDGIYKKRLSGDLSIENTQKNLRKTEEITLSHTLTNGYTRDWPHLTLEMEVWKDGAHNVD